MSKVKRQILANFYQKIVPGASVTPTSISLKWDTRKLPSIESCNMTTWGSHLHSGKVSGICGSEADLPKVIHLFRLIKPNIAITAREGPYATFK